MKNEVLISGTVRDRTGKVISHRSWRAHSYVANFVRFLSWLFDTTATVAFKDKAGVSRNFATDITALAAAANDAFGILVGEGTTPLAIDDVDLDTPDTASDFTHAAVVMGAVSITGTSSAQFSLSRVLTNIKGATIHLSECGLFLSVGSTPYYCMIERTVFPSWDIPDGATFSLIYTVRVTV